MNLFTTELSRICTDLLLHEKWLISPSLRTGHQWLDSLTSAGKPVVNVRVKTIKGLALELAGSEMARSGVTLVTAMATQVIADTILERLQSVSSGYLASLPGGPTLSQTLAHAINALRQSEITADQLQPSWFEAAQKGLDLAFALEEFQRILRENRFVDYADVLRMATVPLANSESPLPRDVVVLVPEDLESTFLERTLLSALPDARCLRIAMDQPGIGPPRNDYHETDADLLRWVLRPAVAPRACGDGTAAIFRAVGEINEIRHVIRTCLSRGYSLDEVEILHTDPGVYVPLVYETFVSLGSDGATDPPELPVTFAEGIPATYSRPGRALIALMDWIGDGYLQAALAQMIQDGLLQLPGASTEDFSFIGIASLFRSLPIRMGRERYIPAITAAISHAERQAPSTSKGRGRGIDSSAVARTLEAMKLLQDLVTCLLEICPADSFDTHDLLQTAEKFIEDYAGGENQLDNYARNALAENIREMTHWTGQIAGDSRINFHDWLKNLPARTRVCGSGPRPGCIHVAHVLSGGHSGRPHTFIVGLDDGRFPGLGLNDPLLLDRECERISPNLPRASIQLGRKLEAFARLLAGLRGTIHLGFSCHTLVDDRENFAGSLVFSAYRILSNNREGDQADMLRWLPPAASFAADVPDQCLNETEWWLWRFCGDESVVNAQEALANRFPHLSQGSIAAAARSGEEFTVYDGLLPGPSIELDPRSAAGPIMSASMFETIGRCPLSYFFKYVLDIQRPDDPTLDPTRWLDPLEFGNLLHEVFYRFMNELLLQRRLPLVSRDRPMLMKILQERADRYAKIIPPPNSSAFRQQIIQLTRAADIFLTEEEELCRVSKPVFLEASIGMRPYEAATMLDTEEPVTIPLSSGRCIRARGRIDRIDVLDEGSQSVFSIWDYKSGSPLKYRREDVFDQGRVIQHALYVYMAATLLRKKVSPNAEVKQFGYFFPGVGARGLRIVRWRRQMDEAIRIMELLCETVARGCFIATENSQEDCRYCDYVMACGDVEAVAESAKRKLKNLDNANLWSTRELRNSGN